MFKNIRIGAALLGALTFAQAQLPTPQLQSAFPPGGQVGTTFEVSLSGTAVEHLNRLIVSHPGITAEPVMEEPDPFLNEAQRKPGRFKVTIAADVPPGNYDLFGAGPFGASNPRCFLVERNAVLTTKPANQKKEAVALAFNQVVYGKADKDQLHYFKIEAKKGQWLAIECHAQRIDSRMDATLQWLDAAGNLLDQNLNAKGLDPQLYVEVPADGTYLIGIYDFTYQGGVEYPYRLSVTDGPHVDFLFPPAGKTGTKQPFTLYGINLPGREKQIEITVPEPTGRLPLFSTTPMNALPAFAHLSEAGNPVWIGLTKADLVIETPENDTAASAQEVPPECDVAARFEKSGDTDWFSFTAPADGSYQIDVISERIGIAVDPVMLIYKAETEAGKKTFIAEADDTKSTFTSTKLRASHRDPTYRLKAAANTRYLLAVKNQFGQGAPGHIYRLVIQPHKPDFFVAAAGQPVLKDNKNQAAPWGPYILNNGSLRIPVYVERQGGFNEPVVITAQGLPDSLRALPCTIPGSADRGHLMLRCKKDPEAWSGTFQIKGEADIGGTKITKTAAFSNVVWPVDNTSERFWQARLSTHVPVGIVSQYDDGFRVVRTEDKPLEHSIAGSLKIPLKVEKVATIKSDVKMSFVGIDQLKNLNAGNIKKDKDTGQIKLDFTKANHKRNKTWEPGTYSFVLLSEADREIKLFESEARDAEEKKKKLEGIRKEAEQAFNQTKQTHQDAVKNRDQLRKTFNEEQRKLNELKKKPDENAEQIPEQEKKVLEVEAARKAAEQKEPESAAAVKAGDERAKKAKALFDHWNKRAQDLANLAKPKNMKAYVYSDPFTVTLTEAPIRITAVEAPESCAAESEVDITVKIERLYGFKDPVELIPALPSGTKGLTVKKVSIPGDKQEAKIKVTCAKDVAEGEVPITVTVRMKLNNEEIKLTREVKLHVKAPPAPETQT